MSQYSDKLKDGRWQRKRLEILERDNWCCVECAASGMNGAFLHVHHKYYRQGCNPWDYHNDDLVTLCNDCHDIAHGRTKPIATIKSDNQLGIPAYANRVIEMILYQPVLVCEVTEEYMPVFLRECEYPSVRLMFSLINGLHDQFEVSTGDVLERWRGKEESRYLYKLSRWTPPTDNYDLLTNMYECLIAIQYAYIESRIESMDLAQMQRQLSCEEKQEYGGLLLSVHKLKGILR